MKHNLSDFDISRAKAIKENSSELGRFSLANILSSVDLKKESYSDKKKAMVVYKMLKWAIPVTAISFCAVMWYGAISDNVRDISVSTNGISISFNQSTSVKNQNSLSSLAADENIDFFSSSGVRESDSKNNLNKNLGKQDQNLGKVWNSDLVGKLKSITKKDHSWKSAFFVFNDNSVVFPVTKDKNWSVFSESQVKTYLETIGIRVNAVSLQSFPNTYIEAISRLETADETSKNELTQILKKNFYTKDWKVLISKKAFWVDYNYYESFLNEITEVSNWIIQISN